ncbi:hypothetical protein HS088_TW14G01246 [Tripterygium wilfordii]|uniref:Uncharacterized protein n=1 Tax=Tripterygium wilfordii TaxID=458696 RepID=A0A7J7CSZ8_TRIWF|nr:hypothetical protein HS088_TW14G01246 [Tripterygium wilfordii]
MKERHGYLQGNPQVEFKYYCFNSTISGNIARDHEEVEEEEEEDYCTMDAMIYFLLAKQLGCS